MVQGAVERETERTIILDGLRYRVASRAEAKAAGEKRSYDPTWISRQNVDARQPFELPLKSFHLGYGFTFAENAGVYEQADGWVADASGKLSTWGAMTTCEPFTSSSVRGFECEYNGFYYAFRGEWAVKYRPQDSAAVWPIVEFHYFGSAARVNGKPVVHNGSLYVPLRGLTIDTLERWQRLTTSVQTVVETQVLTMTGTPTGGTFTVSFADGLTTTVTAALAYDITDADMQVALRLVPGLGKVRVVRTGSGNFVWTLTMTGAPSAMGTSSPPQATIVGSLTGGTSPVITPTTSVVGTSDRWDRGPSGAEATTFAFFDGKLTRGLGNSVSSADADPLTLANWGPSYPVGDATRIIPALGVFERFLVPIKEDGIWTFDSTATAIPEPLGIEGVIDSRAGVGAEAAHAFLWVPHRTGLLRWRPGGPYAYIGPEQDGQYDKKLSPGSGRIEAIGPFGKTLYFTANDTVNAKGVIGSLTPGAGERGPYTPHMHHLLDVPVEDIKVISYTGAPVSTLYPATVVNDATVGANNWTNPGNVSALDAVYATLATYGISKYLKTTGFGFAIPANWTIDGIMALVRRDRSGGDTTVTVAYTGAEVDFIVPAGVTALTVDAQGAAGGTGGAYGITSGKGARTIGTIVVTPGETLKVRVGGIGGAGGGAAPGAGGYNGGGAGGTAGFGSHAGRGGGGGGVSEIRRSTTRLLSAGGGGGASAAVGYAGGPGGAGGDPTGANGTGYGDAGGGGGGSFGAGGAGGTAGYLGDAGTAGTSGTGGDGGRGYAAGSALGSGGGGGGGGYPYGGGGGGGGNTGNGSGGGGSSYYGAATGVTLQAGYREGSGQVVLSYGSTDHIDDYSVKIVKAGTISGAERAYAVNWAYSTPTTFAYGSPIDKWGLSWVPTDVNSPTFGLAFAAQLFGTAGMTAKVDSIALQVYATPPGGGESIPFLVVMTTDSDGTICTPFVYKLPVNGQVVANDDNVGKAVSGKDFYTSRYYAPEKGVQKQYSTAEVWWDPDPLTNIPGLVVWATVNDGTPFRLSTAGGEEVIRERGFNELFFPPTDAAVGDYVQLHFEVPALTGSEVPVAVERLEITVRGEYQPLRSEVAHITVILEPEGQRSVRQQMNDLLAISQRGHPPVPMQDIYGEDGWAHVPMPAFVELSYREGEPQKVAATFDLRKVPYGK